MLLLHGKKGVDKAISGGNANVVPGVSVDDYTNFVTDALKDKKVDVSRRWWQPYKMWVNKVKEASDEMDKKSGGNQWFHEWLRKRHPDSAKKLWGDDAKDVSKASSLLLKHQQQAGVSAAVPGSPAPTKVFAPPNQNLQGAMSPTPITSSGPPAPGPGRSRSGPGKSEKIGGSMSNIVGNSSTSDAADMHISDSGLQQIKKHEGLVKKIYDDHGHLAVGYGHDLLPGEIQKYNIKGEISEATANELLKNDIEKFENIVRKSVRVPLSQNQFDALVSLAYNTGSVPKSVLERINSGDMGGAAQAMQTAKITSQGTVNPGLISRRKEESALFASNNAPQMMNNAPAADQGMRLTQASTQQRDLSRTLMAANNTPPANVSTVIAPKSITTNTTVQDTKAQNSESTYQRTMNSQYVST